MSKDIDPQILRQLLRYEPETGKLYWLPRNASWFAGKTAARSVCLAKIWNDRYANKEALAAVHHNGSKHGHLFGQMYLAHRVIWALVNGEWPELVIDHINGNRSDNRMINLRCVSHSDNMSNTKLQSSSVSGFHGVTWHKRMKRWQVSIRNRYVGTFKDLEAAVSARLSAEQDDGRFHQNHGRI